MSWFSVIAPLAYPRPSLLECSPESQHLLQLPSASESSSRRALLILYLPFCITQTLGSVLPLEATKRHTIQQTRPWAPDQALCWIPETCFLTCIQISQEAGQVFWYSHLFQNFPQFIVIHTVKGFGIVNSGSRCFSGTLLLFP